MIYFAKLDKPQMVLATPAYLNEPPEAQAMFAATVKLLWTNNPAPDWVVGDPEAQHISTEDEGRTYRTPFAGTQTVYCIRDDYGDHYVITFLLARDY